MNVEVLIGCPGAGKTTTLLNIVDQAMRGGIPVKQIGYVSFTRKAIRVARSRAQERVGATVGDLQWFRTLHSMAYREGPKSFLMTGDILKEFAHQTGVLLKEGPLAVSAGDLTPSSLNNENLHYRHEADDPAFALMALARNKYPGDAESLHKSYIESRIDRSWESMRAIAQAYINFKASRHVVDHTDVLENFLSRGMAPRLQLLCIDEAQDLSPLQWLVAEKLMAKATRTVLVGDDDQAIFQWAGASPTHFRTYATRAHNVNRLSQSYRCPQVIQSTAVVVAEQIKERLPKDWKPRPESGKFIRSVSSFFDLPLHEGNWLILGRNNHNLHNARDFMERHSEEDWKLRADVRTIHRAKGAEADNVLLIPDVTRLQSMEIKYGQDLYGAAINSDEELRVLYVGLTRARENLYVYRREGAWGYNL